MNRVTEYAQKVVAGKIPSGNIQWLACKRHLNDLKRQETDEFPFYFDAKKADEIINFMELLVIAEGDEPTPLVLRDFQAFCFGSLHGWRKTTGKRRFRTSYIQLSRQQGKSLFNGGMSIFYGNFSGYAYPQVYAAATKQDQAKIVLKECIKFINADPELAELFHVKEYMSTIDCLNSNGTIKALGKDTKSIDGFRTYFGSVDEYHAHKDDQIYKLLQSGTKRLDESLISVITTSGFDLNSPCFALYEYCKLILEGVVENEGQFVFITELDKDDDPYDEKNWIKSNPLWDETTLESLRNFAKQAKAMGGSEEMEFFTKSLNMWVDFMDTSYIKASSWKKCGSKRNLKQFLKDHPDAKCYAGLDLSKGGDLTSLAFVFVYYENGEKKYYVHTHSFIPKQRVLEHEKTDKAPYRVWINKGLLTVTETLSGIKTDYKYIISYLDRLIDELNLDIQMICYDPYNASAFLSDLEDLGYPTIEIKQSARSLSEPTEDFALEVEAQNVEYDEENKLLTWSVVNAKTVSNSFGERKVDKQSAAARIDPVDATIDAWKMAMIEESSFNIQNSVDTYLEMMKEWG